MIKNGEINMKTVVERVDALKPEVAALIREIHDNPEVGYQEYKAVELQAALLEKYGFTVEKGVAGLDTAYRAVYKGAKEGPRVGYLAEYDALEKELTM